MGQHHLINFAVQMYGAAITLVFLAGYLLRERVHNTRAKCFSLLLIANLLMMVSGGLGDYFFYKGRDTAWHFMALSFAACYLLLALCSRFIWLLILERKKISTLYIRIIYVLCAAGGIARIAVVYRHIIPFDESLGKMERAGRYWPGQFFALIIVAINIYLLITNMKEIGKTTALILAVTICFPLAAQFLPMSSWMALRNSAITLSGILCTLFRQIEDEQKWLEQETTLKETRLFILKSQLQPHFLHNVLTTIYYLCGKDPDRAEMALHYLSDYLETNLRELDRYRNVPFSEELKQVESYLYLEKLRFGSRLNVEMNVRERDFQLPSMTLQPIVENSVKHGVSKKVYGGTVRISTLKENGFFVITVEDDGLGFSMERSEENAMAEGRKVQLGLRNVDERLKILSGGGLKVESAPGYGTKVIVRVPAAEPESLGTVLFDLPPMSQREAPQ